MLEQLLEHETPETPGEGGWDSGETDRTKEMRKTPKLLTLVPMCKMHVHI